MDQHYTHYLVTKGRSPETQRRPNHLLPLALSPIEAGLRAAQSIAEDSLRKCALALNPHNPTGFQTLVSVSQPWIVKALGDLWISSVRLATNTYQAYPDEEPIEWILLDDPRDRLPPLWQGPADAVIPRIAPVTIRKRGTEARFEVELTA